MRLSLSRATVHFFQHLHTVEINIGSASRSKNNLCRLEGVIIQIKQSMMQCSETEQYRTVSALSSGCYDGSQLLDESPSQKD